MTNLLERSKEISDTLAAFINDVEPVKARFYKFLDEYEPQGSDVPDYDLVGFSTQPSPSEFNLNVHEMGEGKGLTFETTVRDYGDSQILYFTIPDAYLADPVAFEEAFLQKRDSEHLKAKKIVAGIFGEEVLEDVIVDAYSMYTLEDDGTESDNGFLVINVGPKQGKRPGRSQNHAYMLSMSRSYAWDVQTGKFYYGGWSIAYDVARGENPEAMGEVIL